MQNRPKPAGPWSRAESKEVSGLDLVEGALSKSVPLDEPGPSVLEIPPGHVLVVLAGIWIAAHQVFTEATNRGLAVTKTLKEKAKRLGPAADQATEVLENLATERKVISTLREQVVAYLGGRLHQVRFTRVKRLVLTAAVVGGEVALNSAAAYQEGDPLVLAVLSFLGVGAAVAGVGWLGAQLREAFDQPRFAAASLPQALAHFAGPPRALRALTIWSLGVLGVSVAVLGIGVAVLRDDAGSVAVYGVFTAVTVLGASAISYCGHDPVADVLGKLDERLAANQKEADAATAALGAYRAARAAVRTYRAETAKSARAQWDAVVADGLLLLVHQPHLVGGIVPAEALCLSPEEFEAGDWRRWGTAKGAGVADTLAPLALLPPSPNGHAPVTSAGAPKKGE